MDILFNLITNLCLPLMVAVIMYMQFRTEQKLVQISLYKERYEKIYKLILTNIEEQQKLFRSIDSYDSAKQEELTEKFTNDLDYARFLIKKSDFEKILHIYNNAYGEIINNYQYIVVHQKDDTNKYNKEFSEKRISALKRIEKEKQNFIKVITKYQQIN